jgi:MOSC domain-containing protein YiiM
VKSEALIDSESVGDPARFQTLEVLMEGLHALPPGPARSGTVASVVVRGEPGGLRQTPDRVRLTSETGVDGDAWMRLETPNPEGQVTVMQAPVAKLIANGQSLTLFGDNLFLDLDLSSENLPPGTKVQVGTALLEVTPKPHNGCTKFRGRFGADALRFVSHLDLRSRNLRGIHMRVLHDGDVGPGDPVEVIERASPVGTQG